MDNTLSTKDLPCRKQITFDLNENLLRERYPRSEKAKGERYHKKAWTDIAQFLIANNFKHRQYSVYDSAALMRDSEVYELIWVMANCMPWVSECVDVIDVTNIGEHHDLTPFIKTVEIKTDIG